MKKHVVRHFELSDKVNFKPHRLISREITELLTFVFIASFAVHSCRDTGHRYPKKKAKKINKKSI